MKQHNPLPFSASHTKRKQDTKADLAIAAALENYPARQASLPRTPEVHYALAQTLMLMGNSEQAQLALCLVLELDPLHLAAVKDYAALLQETKRHEEAGAMYRRAIALDGSDPLNYCRLGVSLQATGALDEAMNAYQQMLTMSPDSALAYNNIGSIQQERNQLEMACQNFRQALEIEPDFTDAVCNLGINLLRQNKLEEALAYTFRAIELDPLHLQARTNISSALFRQGRNDEAVEQCRLALAVNPQWQHIHSNLLFSMVHSEQANAAELFAEHRRYAEQFEAPHRAHWPRHANTPDPHRRLRIGFVSADLYNHVIASYITPVLEHLRHAPDLELVAYASSLHDDTNSRHLKELVSEWRQVEKLSDDELAQLIISDGIDVLIDLSGHTGGNRLLTFARKPAPLQASWMGYPMTTGLQAMDYYFSDRHFSPPGLLDAQFSEKLLLLPASAPFLPPADAPAVSAPPALKNGYVTFGSFNRPGKLSRKVIGRWAQLLKAMPTARMLIAGMSSDTMTAQLQAWFGDESIAQDRLDFHAHTGTAAYLKLHEQVDICLDTAPYTGGTTNLYALWMGVPTLTMTGATLANRNGASISKHMGLDDFIALDDADFLAKGCRLAADLPYLAALRTQTRTRMTNAAIGQPALIAAGLDNALRTAWQRWCKGLPAIAFEADAQQSPLSGRARSHKILHEVNVDVALPLAIAHHQAERFEQAETLYLAIIHAQPSHPIANHNLGLLAGQLGFHEMALPYFHKAVSHHPEEGQFHYSYINALLQAGQASAALTALAAAVDGGHDGEQAQALRQRAAALLEQPPSQEEEARIVDLFETGRYAELELAAQALVERCPHSGFAWSVLGTALQVQGKDALQTLQRAVQLTPHDAQAQGNLGNEWQAHGQPEAAIACYLQALALDPQFAMVYGNLARAQQTLGQLHEAADSFQRALALEPDNQQIQAELALLQ